MRLQSALGLVIAMIPVVVTAQQFMRDIGPPVDPTTRFEVVAIKAIDTATGQVLMRAVPGRFESQVPLGVLLRQALQKADYQVVGAPGWVDTERYAITAKVPEGVSPLAISVLLMNLLKDRFQLRTHVETRDLPIFNLVLARSDGRLGPELKATAEDCRQTIEARNASVKALASAQSGPPAALPAIPGPNDPVPCGFLRTPPGQVSGRGWTIAQIMTPMADVVGRPVVDKTGLTGLYDVNLKYAHDGRATGLLGLLGASVPVPDVDPDAPSIFTAVQEQLGLKLESARGPVEVVVVDKLERPALD